MPTLSAGSPGEQFSHHDARRIAESFGADAQAYDDARPPYPAELVQRLIGGDTGLGVLDVGCGTGIAGLQFQDAGCAVLGVEPDERMARIARAKGLIVETAAFETWDAAGRTFDLVTAAQSWHWIDPVLGPQKAAAALRPEGRLAIFGHVFEPPDEIAGPLADALQRVAPDSPFPTTGRRPLEVYQAGYAHLAQSLRESGLFGEAEQWRFDWTHRYGRDAWLAVVASTGAVTPLSIDQKAKVLHAVGTAIDALGGEFTMEYVTLATVTRRR